VSSDHSGEELLLQQQVEQSEGVLDDLEADLREVNAELEQLAERNHQYDVLTDVCRSIEELDGIGATHLFWSEHNGPDNPVEHLRNARRKINEFGEEVARVEERRESILQKVGKQNDVLDYLHYDLQDAIEREEARRNEWLEPRSCRGPEGARRTGDIASLWVHRLQPRSRSRFSSA
jgi:DNA repair exonuclease SbcCD ATPase subunit